VTVPVKATGAASSAHYIMKGKARTNGANRSPVTGQQRSTPLKGSIQVRRGATVKGLPANLLNQPQFQTDPGSSITTLMAGLLAVHMTQACKRLELKHVPLNDASLLHLQQTPTAGVHCVKPHCVCESTLWDDPTQHTILHGQCPTRISKGP
jgi:hypothetical protein